MIPAGDFAVQGERRWVRVKEKTPMRQDGGEAPVKQPDESTVEGKTQPQRDDCSSERMVSCR